MGVAGGAERQSRMTVGPMNLLDKLGEVERGVSGANTYSTSNRTTVCTKAAPSARRPSAHARPLIAPRIAQDERCPWPAYSVVQRVRDRHHVTHSTQEQSASLRGPEANRAECLLYG